MKKIKLLSLMLALVLAVGCSSTQDTSTGSTSEGASQSATLKSGTFTAKAGGYGGEMTVEVDVQDEKITDIRMTEHHESSPVIKRAFPVIKDRIIEAQSPIVDSVSGATFSSYAVKKAVADAMKETGKDFGEITMATQGPAVEKKELEAVETQLVIVGGGPAGLSAAIEAKTNGVENVILIEKLDILSGNGKFDMNFFDIVNTQAQKANGIEDSAEKFYEDKKKSAWDSDERIKVWSKGAAEADNWLRSMDIQLNYNYSGRSHMAEADAYAGEAIQDKLEAKVKELGVDVRTGTKGIDLIIENGKATGVKVECKEGTYDIKANAVIVATGGFSHNKELLAKYAPGAEKVATSNQMGATGDFVSIFEKHNIALKNMDKLSIFKTIISGRRDLTGAGDGFIFVNKNGERFTDETVGGMDTANAILAQDGGAYYIYDQKLYDSAYRLKKHNDLGYHKKANTLEELAKELGINPENLVKTVETYNKAIDGEMADPFRKKEFKEDMKFNTEGPFYGVKVESAIHMTKGGVAANENAQVLDNNGKVVEGLYAAGEVTDTSGAYSASVVFGRVSGEQAAKYILK